MNLGRLTLMLVAAMGFSIMSGDLISQPKANRLQPGKDTKPITPLVTFVELGSLKCIPCKQMQPVMKAIEEKYGGQVNVVFHDVWTDSGRPFADTYQINLIPTQVFLDANGKEFFRHEGFYPEEEIHRLLQKRGLKILATKG